MEIKPLLDKVVLEPLEPEEKTASGILLPNSAQEKPSMAKVVAVGDGGMVDGCEVKMLVAVGDRVLYSKYAGSEMKIDGQVVKILSEKDILGIIE